MIGDRYVFETSGARRRRYLLNGVPPISCCGVGMKISFEIGDLEKRRRAGEWLCTGGLPALYTRVLSLQQLEGWAYYGYLVLYNIVYMLDDVVVLAIGVITLSRYSLQGREGCWLKLISGLVIARLGMILVLKPEWLAP